MAKFELSVTDADSYVKLTLRRRHHIDDFELSFLYIKQIDFKEFHVVGVEAGVKFFGSDCV